MPGRFGALLGCIPVAVPCRDGSSCPTALGGKPESDPVDGLSIPRFQHLPLGAVVEGGVWGQEEGSALQAERTVDVGTP